MPVLFGGPSWCWLGANLNSAGELYLNCNGMDRAPSGEIVTAGE